MTPITKLMQLLTPDGAAIVGAKLPDGSDGSVQEAFAAFIQAAVDAAVPAAIAGALEAALRAEAAQAAVFLSTGIYDTKELGIIGTVDSQYFSVPSPIDIEYLILYKNIAGVPKEIDRYPNGEGLKRAGFEFMDSTISGLAHAITDAHSRQAWTCVALDGGPTEDGMKKIGARLTPENAPRFIEAMVLKAVEAALLELGTEPLGSLNSMVSTVVDAFDRRSWLEIDTDGGPTQNAIRHILKKLPSDIGGPAEAYASGIKGTRRIASGPNITWWGDSMTAGAGGSGTTGSGVLQALLAARGSSATVFNRGVGGENTLTIAARAGANPFIALPKNGVIPANTAPFEIILEQINGFVPKPLMQGASSYTGKLGNIEGTFSKTNVDTVYTYYFARKAPGATILADRPLPLYLDIGEIWREDIAIIWIGQNGPSTERAIQDAKAIIQRLTTLDKRYIVISKPGGTTAENADDALWFAEFGRRFIPIRQYMVRFGLADAGMVPTSDDLIDIANGTVPRQLRSDAVHWLAPGYTILGNQVFQRLIELEWI